MPAPPCACSKASRRSGGTGRAPSAPAWPNKGLELTASSVRSAPASGSSSGLALGCCCAALLAGVAQGKADPARPPHATRTVSPGVSPPHQPVPGPTAGEGPPAVVLPPMPTGGPMHASGCGVGTILRAGPSWWPQPPAAAWRVPCAGPRERRRACWGAAWRPRHREHGRGVVGWSRALRQSMSASLVRQRGVLQGRVAAVGVGVPAAPGPHRGHRSGLPGGRAGHGGARVLPPCASCGVSRHHPGPTGCGGIRRLGQ